MSRINIWIALLLVSVLANGVLLGVSARSWLIKPEPASVTRVQPERGFSLRAFVAALPEDRREAARERARAERSALREEFRALALARREVRLALEAQAFDAETVSARLEAVRAVEARIQARTETIILEIAETLNPQEREIAMEAAMGPRRPPRGGPGG